MIHAFVRGYAQRTENGEKNVIKEGCVCFVIRLDIEDVMLKHCGTLRLRIRYTLSVQLVMKKKKKKDIPSLSILIFLDNITIITIKHLYHPFRNRTRFVSTERNNV